jgi:hypothetical protein
LPLFGTFPYFFKNNFLYQLFILEQYNTKQNLFQTDCETRHYYCPITVFILVVNKIYISMVEKIINETGLAFQK